MKTTHDKFLVIIHFWKIEINKRLLISVNLKLCLIFLKFFGRIIPGRIWETTTTAKRGNWEKKFGGKWGKNHLKCVVFFSQFLFTDSFSNTSWGVTKIVIRVPVILVMCEDFRWNSYYLVYIIVIKSMRYFELSILLSTKTKVCP